MLVQGLLWFSQETLPVQQLARHTLCSARPVQWSVSMPELWRSHTSSIPHMRQGVVPEALSTQPIMRSADGDFGQSMIDGASGRTRCRISACLPSAMWVSLSCRTLRTTAHVPAQCEGSTSGKSVSETLPSDGKSQCNAGWDPANGSRCRSITNVKGRYSCSCSAHLRSGLNRCSRLRLLWRLWRRAAVSDAPTALRWPLRLARSGAVRSFPAQRRRRLRLGLRCGWDRVRRRRLGRRLCSRNLSAGSAGSGRHRDEGAAIARSERLGRAEVAETASPASLRVVRHEW